MCYNPVIIKNNRRDFYRSLHPTALSVPCGYCDDCVNMRRSDYATRTAFECKKFSVGNGGTAIMVLLTYNDAHVPYLPHTDQMCFNRHHIKMLNDMLRAYFFSDKDNPKFAYLIGAEYGVDERFTQRPHYHGLYILSSSIDPHEFMSVIRQIWQGQLHSVYQASHKHTYSWSYGELGYVLPFEGDKEHEYIVKDAAGASLYCAKYAVKQVGFYNKPSVDYFLTHNMKHTIIQYLPRVFTSRGFGKSMIYDSTFDPVTQKVINPYSLKSVTIPRSVMEMYLYDKVFRGRTRPVFDPVTHEMLTKKDGSPKMRKLYDREYKTSAFDVRISQLKRMIDNYSDKICGLGCISSIAHDLAIYHYVFKALPIPVVYNKFKLGLDSLTPYLYKYVDIYKYTKLYRFSLQDAIYNDNYKPVYKCKTLELLRTNDFVVKDDGIMTFDSLLSDEMRSLYTYYSSLLSDIDMQSRKERDKKYSESQELRLLTKGEHPQ